MDQVTRIDAAGNAQTLEMSAEDTLLTFSVNREGSTFLMDDTSMELLNHYYIQSVTENITISEINVDPLKEYAVSLN